MQVSLRFKYDCRVTQLSSLFVSSVRNRLFDRGFAIEPSLRYFCVVLRSLGNHGKENFTTTSEHPPTHKFRSNRPSAPNSLGCSNNIPSTVFLTSSINKGSSRSVVRLPAPWIFMSDNLEIIDQISKYKKRKKIRSRREEYYNVINN